VQIKIVQEKYSLNKFWTQFFFIFIVIPLISWIMAILRTDEFKVRAIFPSSMIKLVINLCCILKLVGLLTNIFYLVFYHHI